MDYSDRCDGCSSGAAAAYVTVQKLNDSGTGIQELKFCGHHYGKHETALVVDGWEITSDDRPTLTNRREKESHVG